MNRVQRHRRFIGDLFRSKSRANQLRQVRKSSDPQLCAVCEIVKNVLHNPALNLRLSTDQKLALHRYRKRLRELIDRRVPKERKRRILQSGRGFLLPLLASLAAPIVSKIFGV